MQALPSTPTRVLLDAELLASPLELAILRLHRALAPLLALSTAYNHMYELMIAV